MAIDIDKLITLLHQIALHPYGNGVCATHVRSALEAAGAKTTGHPYHAKFYGNILRVNGFTIVAKASDKLGKFNRGDIAVIQNPKGGKVSGHIQVWDGRNWVSDFVQAAFWPGAAYRKQEPDYEIYRPC